MKAVCVLRGSRSARPRFHGTAFAFAAALAALLSASPALAQDVAAIAVKLRDPAAAAPGATLPAATAAAIAEAFGAPLAANGRTRDGAFVLAPAAPLSPDAARAALNRIRLDPAVLYASAAPGAPVPAATGRPTARLIVKYRNADGTVPTAVDAARISRASAAAGMPVEWMRPGADGVQVLRMLAQRPIVEVEAIAARIALEADVEFAQPDYIREANLVPTDPCYASASVAACNGGYQWDLFDPVGGINMPGAWNITTGASTIRVAVIDTGALHSHPDLANRFVGGYDMIADCAVANDGQPGACTWSGTTPDSLSRDPNAADPGDWITSAEGNGPFPAVPPYDWFATCDVTSSSWHGSHVAGTIGAVPNNGIGIAGINWVSKIVPMRVLGKCGGYTSDISDAIVWAAGGAVPGTPANTNPVRVMNMSLGGGGPCSPVEQTSINTALSLGALVVVSAGNANTNAVNQSPANCSGVMVVAATTKLGRRAYYSNYGSIVDIAAPGGAGGQADDTGILSTINNGAQSPNPSGYIYAGYSGTSMAAPHVTGVASLMLSVNPALTPSQVQSMLQTTARKFPTPGPACNVIPQLSACNCTTSLCGAGILDAAAAVTAALNAGTALASSANPAPAGTAITFTMTVVGNAPTGTVKFEDGATTLAGCSAVPLTGTGNTRTAACTTSTLAVGSHTMKASYSGDGNNAATSANLTQVVIAVATVALASSANPTFVATSITFTAVVAGVNPTGTVQFTDNAAALPGCASVALTGSGNARTAACTVASLAQGNHPIAANYSGDADHGPASAALTQVIAQPIPGTATVGTNPYGPVSVTGATINGNTIFNFSSAATIQLGSTAGAPGSIAQIDFQSLNLGPGNSLTLRSGAPGQTVVVTNTGAAASAIAGALIAQGGNGAPPPYIYFKNGNGLTVANGGSVSATAGLGVDTLGTTWTSGGPLFNGGVLDGGPNLELKVARANGGGQFRGDAIAIRTFGHANNPVNGANFLQNGLQLYPNNGNLVTLTLNDFGTSPQVFNLFVNGNANVWMPSAWPAGYTVPVNNAVVAPNGSRAPGVPPPSYGGGSMILQSTGMMTLVNGGTGDFVFPGAIVLKALGDLNLNGVIVNQGWTTSGQTFQGIFLEAPSIVSPGLIHVYGNNLNWQNFSTFPQANVRAFSLVSNPDGSASFAATDTTTPHLNTYSVIQGAAAAGQCWTCLINTQPVNMYGP